MIREKTLKTAAAVKLIMPNIVGPKPSKRKLLTTIVHSQLLYAAPVWCSLLVFKNHKLLLAGLQRSMALKIAGTEL